MYLLRFALVIACLRSSVPPAADLDANVYHEGELAGSLKSNAPLPGAIRQWRVILAFRRVFRETLAREPVE